MSEPTWVPIFGSNFQKTIEPSPVTIILADCGRVVFTELSFLYIANPYRKKENEKRNSISFCLSLVQRSRRNSEGNTLVSQSALL